MAFDTSNPRVLYYKELDVWRTNDYIMTRRHVP